MKTVTNESETFTHAISQARLEDFMLKELLMNATSDFSKALSRKS